MYIVFTNTF